MTLKACPISICRGPLHAVRPPFAQSFGYPPSTAARSSSGVWGLTSRTQPLLQWYPNHNPLHRRPPLSEVRVRR